MLFDEDRGQALAIIGVDARHRHQILHGHLRGDPAVAHVLLNRFRQQFDQPQAARDPTCAAVETARQFVERVTETLFHLRKQPALFQRAFQWTQPHRSGQEQRVGFAHFPDSGVDRVAAELLERGDAFVAVDDKICAVIFDDNDGRLLSGVSQ